jgi:molybdopterin converting factor small subunit
MIVTITVQCLGQLRDSVARDAITISCPPTAGALLELLANEYEPIAALQGTVVLATSERYLQQEDALTDGMELVLVPPVSGG